jgi:hypothetical protein
LHAHPPIPPLTEKAQPSPVPTLRPGGALSRHGYDPRPCGECGA